MLTRLRQDGSWSPAGATRPRSDAISISKPIALRSLSCEPKGGASFTLFANFGNLHRSAELVEEFPVKETAKDGGR